MFGTNPNTMDIQAVWDAVYQLTHYKQPVYKAFATERLASKLKAGDTVHRTYSSDFGVNTMGADGSYTTQGLTDSDETLVVDQRKEVSFYIPEWQELQFHLPVRMKYARKAANRLFNQIDGDMLGKMQSAASTSVDDGSLGGTAGNGITASVGNVANIFYTVMQQLQLNNVVYDPNSLFTGVTKLDKTKVMPVAAISPQVYNVLMQFLGGKNSQLGDKVSTNGHQGVFAGWNLFVSNNLPWEATLTFPTVATANDTITINGVVLTFVATPAVAGDIVVANNATNQNINLKNALLAPGTLIANSASAGYFPVSLANQYLLANITATNPTTTTTKIVQTGIGNATVSASMTAAANLWKTADQKQHCLFGVSQSIDLIIQRTPNLVINPVSGKVGKDFVTWVLYGSKVFKEQTTQLVDVVIAANGFANPNNTFN